MYQVLRHNFTVYLLKRYTFPALFFILPDMPANVSKSCNWILEKTHFSLIVVIVMLSSKINSYEGNKVKTKEDIWVKDR